MRIGQRLLLAVAPGVIGVLAVAALAYWGERGRQVPFLLLTIVAVVTVLSLWFAWATTHDIARRIARLSALVDARQGRGPAHEPMLLSALAREAVSRLSGSGKSRSDELDTIERLIARVDGDFARLAERERATHERIAEARAETSRMLYDAGDRIAARLDDVRMPLHVLLDAPFGELNENQEELVGVARSAADEAVTEAHRLRDLGALELSKGARRDRINPAELLRALDPLIQAEARRARVSVSMDLSPALPAVAGDRARLQEAIREVLARVVQRSDAQTSIVISAATDTNKVRISISPVAGMVGEELAVERRLLEALGASLVLKSGIAQIDLSTW